MIMRHFEFTSPLLYRKKINPFMTELILTRHSWRDPLACDSVICNFVQAGIISMIKKTDADIYNKMHLVAKLSEDFKKEWDIPLKIHGSPHTISDVIERELQSGSLDLMALIEFMTDYGIPITYTGIAKNVNSLFDNDRLDVIAHLYDKYPDMVVSEEKLTFKDYCHYLAENGYQSKALTQFLEKVLIGDAIRTTPLLESSTFKV